MLLRVSAAVPLLVRVMVCAALVVETDWLAKARLLGEKVTAGATPVPLSDSCCGLAAALSVKVMAPVRVPVAVGVKVTEIVQTALAARLVPQLLV